MQPIALLARWMPKLFQSPHVFGMDSLWIVEQRLDIGPDCGFECVAAQRRIATQTLSIAATAIGPNTAVVSIARQAWTLLRPLAVARVATATTDHQPLQ